MSWVAGAWLQARVDERGGNLGRRRRIVVGFVLLAAGSTAITVAVALHTDLHTGLSAAIAIAGWAVGGVGMGLVYPSVTTLALGQSTDAEKGATSGNLQLAETLSVALVTGVGGAIIAYGQTAGWVPVAALVAVFAVTTLAAVTGIATGTRTLDTRPGQSSTVVSS